MNPIVAGVIPADLSQTAAALLVGVALLTAAVGIGGGLALLAVMAALVPPAALIPIHGVVQLGSNVGRAAVQLRHVLWPTLGVFGLGVLAGAAVGGRIVFGLDPVLLRLAVAAFVLWTVWGPSIPRRAGGGRPMLVAGGLGATVLTMFVGATGPFVAALIGPLVDGRRALVATQGAAMVLQHAVKVAAFGWLGFAIGEWLALMLMMVTAGFAGTLVGTRILRALPEALFPRLFRTVMSLLALWLIVGAASGAGV